MLCCAHSCRLLSPQLQGRRKPALYSAWALLGWKAVNVPSMRSSSQG